MKGLHWTIILSVVIVAYVVNGQEATEKFPHLFQDFENMARISSKCEFVYNGSLPDVPSEITVYKNRKKEVNESILSALAAKFDMHNIEINLRDTGSSVVSKTEGGTSQAILSLCDSNIEEFSYLDCIADLGSRKNGLPSESEAVVVAEAYLKAKNLYPDNAYVERVGYGLVHTTGIAEIGKTYIYVLFKRKMNGLPCETSKIKVIILPSNHVAELYYSVWDWESIGQYPIIYPEEAIDYAKINRGDPVKTPKGSAASILIAGETTALSGVLRVSKVYLAYRRGPILQGTTYLQPIYVINGTTEAGDQFILHIPALKRELFE